MFEDMDCFERYCTISYNKCGLVYELIISCFKCPYPGDVDQYCKLVYGKRVADGEGCLVEFRLWQSSLMRAYWMQFL